MKTDIEIAQEAAMLPIKDTYYKNHGTIEKDTMVRSSSSCYKI